MKRPDRADQHDELRTDYKLAVGQLSSAHERRILKAAVAGTRMAMVATDPHQPDNPIVFANSAFLDMTGYAAEQVLGRNCRFLQGPKTDPGAVARIREAVASCSQIEIELLNYKRDGAPFSNQLFVSPIRDETGCITHFFASQMDVSAQRVAEEATKVTEDRLRLTANELNHRVKNTIATVQAIVRQTMRSAATMQHAEDVITGRLLALGQAHDALIDEAWEHADLGQLIHRTVQPHSDSPGRFSIDGPAVDLGPRAAQATVMAVHELCTNSVKYGALSVPSGTVAITWSVRDDSDATTLFWQWQERGGPPVSRPGRDGFGSQLIKKALASGVRGTVWLNFEQTGVCCLMQAPLPTL